MGFFSFLTKTDDSAAFEEARNDADVELVAPISGTLMAISEVPDLVISEKLIGDGIAIVPEDNTIVAPCEGTISRLIASKNAFAIKTAFNVEVYVSFGIGTSQFSGVGFSSEAAIGDHVMPGDPVISVDMNRASEHLESTITSMIVVKSSAKISRVVSSKGKVTGGKTPCTWVILENKDETQKKESAKE